LIWVWKAAVIQPIPSRKVWPIKGYRVELQLTRLGRHGHGDDDGERHLVDHLRVTGFTLPGMMLEPACRAGSRSSPKLACGPEDSSRRSLQILETFTTAARLRAW
jgi:hypothetical protein